MTQEEINKNNILIAEFMGTRVFNNIVICFEGTLTHNERCLHGYNIAQAEYNMSWDWLIPVVEKIESIEDNYHGHFGVHIVSNSCTIQATNFRSDKQILDPPHYFNCVTLDSKLESTYLMAIRFITWYNKQSKNDRTRS
jgi:hypothetical protein